jgi:hypothetical protein
MIEEYKSLARKHRAKWPFGRLKCIFKDNKGVKYIAREIGSEGGGHDEIGLRHESILNSRKYGNCI